MSLFFTLKSSSSEALSNVYAVSSIESIRHDGDGGISFSYMTLTSGNTLNIVESLVKIIEKISSSKDNEIIELQEFEGDEEKLTAENGWTQ